MPREKTPENILVSVHKKLVAEGVKALLDRNFDYNTFVTDYDDKDKIIALCNEQAIDVVILDVDHPMLEIFSLIEQLVSDSLNIEVIAVTNRNRKSFLQKIIKAGTRGLVLKSSGMEMLKKALEHVAEGEHYFCDKATVSMIQDAEDNQRNEVHPRENLLTDREREVLGLICQEMTNPEIAEKLQISVRTVDAHRRNLLQKTGAKNTVGLVKYAVRHQLVDI